MNYIKLLLKENYLYILLSFIIIFSFCFMYCPTHLNGLWYDEYYSVYIAQQAFPLGILDKLCNEEHNAPLYFFLLHFWLKLIDTTSPMLIRLFSNFIGCASIISAFFIGKKLLNKKMGIIFSALLAFNALHIYYAQEVRYYCLVEFLSLFSIFFNILFLKATNKKNIFGFVISNILLIYTYTLGLVFVFFQTFFTGLYLIIAKKSEKLKQFIYYCVFLSLGILIYLPMFFYQFKASSKSLVSPWIWGNSEYSSLYFVLQNYFSPFLQNIQNNIINLKTYFLNTSIFISLISILLLTFAVFFIIKSLINKNDENHKYILITFFTGISFLLFIFVSSVIFGKIILLTRYTLSSFICFIFILAYSIATLKKIYLRNIFISLIILVNIISLFYIEKSQVNYMQRRDSITRIQNDITKIVSVIPDKHFIVFLGTANKFIKLPQNAEILPVDFLELLYLKKSEKLKFFLDDDTYKKINQKNATTLLVEHIKNDRINKNTIDYFNKNVLNKLKKGDYFLVIKTYHSKISEVEEDKIPSQIDILFFSKLTKDFETLSKENKYMVNVFSGGCFLLVEKTKD